MPTSSHRAKGILTTVQLKPAVMIRLHQLIPTIQTGDLPMRTKMFNITIVMIKIAAMVVLIRSPLRIQEPPTQTRVFNITIILMEIAAMVVLIRSPLRIQESPTQIRVFNITINVMEIAATVVLIRLPLSNPLSSLILFNDLKTNKVQSCSSCTLS